MPGIYPADDPIRTVDFTEKQGHKAAGILYIPGQLPVDIRNNLIEITGL